MIRSLPCLGAGITCVPQLPVAEQRDAAGKGRKVSLIHGVTAESILLGDSGSFSCPGGPSPVGGSPYRCAGQRFDCSSLHETK